MDNQKVTKLVVLIVIGSILFIVNPALLAIVGVYYSIHKAKRKGGEAIRDAASELKQELQKPKASRTRQQQTEEKWEEQWTSSVPSWSSAEEKPLSPKRRTGGQVRGSNVDSNSATGSTAYLEDSFSRAYYAAKEKGQEIDPWDIPPDKVPWER